MQMYKVTIPASGNIPIIPQDPVVQRNVSFQTLVFSPAAATYYVGDSTVTATGGGIAVSSTGGPVVIPTAVLTQNLNGWYVAGTSGNVVMVMVLE